jgi:hypothetical protein
LPLDLELAFLEHLLIQMFLLRVMLIVFFSFL